MAEQNDAEKTEEPTSKKLDDAQMRGDVAKSQEVNAWFVMLGGAMAVGLMGTSSAGTIMRSLTAFLAQPQAMPMDPDHLRAIVLHIGAVAFGAMAMPLGVLVLSAVVGNIVQHAPIFSAENMKPSLSKISPVEGLKRLFGPKSLVNFVKSLIKFFVVGAVVFLLIWPERDRLALMMMWDVALLLPLVKALSLKMFGGVIAVMTIVAALDYLFERLQWMKKQRMSIQEIKDEHKQMEGDPTVKAKLRQIRVERGRKRMMANVSKATVVIMNPTHYAVALKYEKGMGAPVCVAKGLDAIALKIREIAEANGVPVIENPPLARALHASVELDREIRPEHYKAVAEVIGYVMRLKAKMTKRGRAN